MKIPKAKNTEIHRNQIQYSPNLIFMSSVLSWFYWKNLITLSIKLIKITRMIPTKIILHTVRSLII